MDPHDIRRWAENHRAAAARERREAQRAGPGSPEQAYGWALELLRLDEAVNGDPFRRSDPVQDREDDAVRRVWATLRERWR